MERNETYSAYRPGTDELIAKLVEDHTGWATAIAKSVARSWNLDWQLDGLDGGAYEGLLFCARRYDPKMGVPFRAYARRRIHESATEEARKSKSWQQATGAETESQQISREISAKLFDVFPELRDGELVTEDGEINEELMRTSVRQMLTSATMLLALEEITASPEKVVDYKRALEIVAELEVVHQKIVYGVYWDGVSMRALAEEWKIDELNIIREHKEILNYVFARIANPKRQMQKLSVRPGLRAVAQEFRRLKEKSPFSQFVVAQIILFLALTYSLLGIASPLSLVEKNLW
ncbi:hypothetical protein JNK13_04940 [bacterium]|nr:hypothetical protein [bacterium]